MLLVLINNVIKSVYYKTMSKDVEQQQPRIEVHMMKLKFTECVNLTT